MIEKYYTIERFIDSASINQISYDKLSLFEKIEDENSYFLIYNVLNDYYDEIIDMSSWLVLTDEEYQKYRFKPKLLAHRLYGDPEIYFMLMFLNNVCNVKEFDFKRLRILRPNELNSVVSKIYNSNAELITSKKGYNL